MSALKVIKSGENVKWMEDGEGQVYLLISKVRLSFPKLAHPELETDDDGRPRTDKSGKQKSSFSGVFMMDKSTHKEAFKYCVEIINKLMKDNDAKVATDKKFIKDGDGETREEYAGQWVISARESKRPPVRKRDGSLVIEPDMIESMMPAGVHVNVLIRPWYFNGVVKGAQKTFPKRISCGLAGVQFNSDDGTRYGGGQIDESDVWDTEAEAGGGGDAGLEDDGEL